MHAIIKFEFTNHTVLRKLLLFFCTLLIIENLFAQQAKQYSFTHYNVNDGLAAYNATSLLQDEKGFMWIGTRNGLQRFDGNRFITFKSNQSNTSSIPDNHIVQLLYDKQKRLWVLLGNGKLGIFDTQRFTFSEVPVKTSNEKFNNSERKLLEDSDGNLLYVIHRLELLTYNKKLNEFSSKHNVIKIPPKWKIAHIIEAPNTKRYWISTDSGMCVYNRRNGKLSYSASNSEQLPFIEQFGKVTHLTNFLIDNKHRLWFHSWTPTGGPFLYCYNLKADTAVLNRYNLGDVVKKYHEPRVVFQQNDSSIWIAGLSMFMKFIEPQKKFEQVYNGYINDQSIYYEAITNLYEDREQNIWVATSNNGVFVFNPARQFFTTIQHVNRVVKKTGEGAVMSFAYTRQGHILAGAWGDGIYRYDSNLNIIPVNMAGIDENAYAAWSICRLKDNRTFWFGLQPGVIVYDEVANQGRYYNPAILENKTVRQVKEDKLGNMWLGTQSRGVFKWEPAKASKNFEAGFSKVENVPTTLIENIYVDSKGYVWICTIVDGIYKLDAASNKILEHITSKGPPSKRLINSGVAAAFEYNDSIMIIVTGGLNIYNTRRNTIEHITSANGLPSDMVMSIEKDNQGYLWLGLLNGLCRVNLEKRSFTYYDRNDGMVNDNFMVVSSLKLPDGRMLFGTSTDFIVFNPGEMITNLPPPNVTITDFKVMNKSLSPDSLQRLPMIELGPEENNIAIEFSSLSFINQFQFYYMLEGIDKDWRKSNGLNQAIYNYLPTGTYTFKVKAANSDRIFSKEVSELLLKVNPPFWKTWWFYSLLILIGAILFYGFDRERMRRKETIQKMRSEIAGNLHEEINTALNSINILSEMAKLKADKDPSKAKEFFEQIHLKSHNMIIAMDDMLWSINPHNDNMQKTTERMREYVDALKHRYGVNIDMLVDKNVESMTLNMKLRHDAFLLFKEGIKSLVEAGAENCSIHIGCEKNNLIYTMQFDNEGCDMQKLNNLLRRQDMEKWIDSINADIDIQVHKSTSIFVLTVPVG